MYFLSICQLSNKNKFQLAGPVWILQNHLQNLYFSHCSFLSVLFLFWLTASTEKGTLSIKMRRIFPCWEISQTLLFPFIYSPSDEGNLLHFIPSYIQCLLYDFARAPDRFSRTFRRIIRKAKRKLIVDTILFVLYNSKARRANHSIYEMIAG